MNTQENGNVENTTTKSMLLNIGFARPCATKKADKRLITCDCDKSSLNVNKKLYVSKEFRAIGNFDQSLRNWILERAVLVNSGFGRGFYVLPFDFLQEIEDKIQSAIPERKDLIDSFFRNAYYYEIENGKLRLKEQYVEADYQSEDVLRSQFSLEWRYVVFEVPDNLPEELKNRELQKFADTLSDIAREVEISLAENLADMLKTLNEKLDTKDNEKKIFRDNRFTKIVEFVDRFSVRKQSECKELSILVSKAKELVTMYSPNDVRRNESIRETVRIESQNLKRQLDDLVATKKTRRFDFSDDSEE